MYPDMDKVAEFLKQTSADEVMPRFRNLKSDEIEEKGPDNYVTAADKGAEAQLSKLLRGAYPGSLVLGEETIEQNGDVIRKFKNGDNVWIIDPIDGTNEFKNGRDYFGMILGYAQKGEVQQSWIYNPVQNKMLMAEKGKGVWIDGQARQVPSTTPPLSACRGVVSTYGFADDLGNALKSKTSSIVAAHGEALSCAQEYPKLVSGDLEFAFYSLLYPWDHAAGVMAFEQAGGYAAHLDGSPYDPLRQDGGLLLARNKEDWLKIKQALFNDPALLKPNSPRFVKGPILSHLMAA